VFQQKQRVGDASFFDKANQCLLQLKRDGVIHAAKVKDVDHPQRHRLILAIWLIHLPQRTRRA
jgi:hypothetical protein